MAFHTIPLGLPKHSRLLCERPLIDENGDLRSGTLSKLLDILAIAKDEELMVDLTFSAETVGDCSAQDCPPGTNGPSLTHTLYKAGIVDMATVISGGGSAYKHVFFDLQNECEQNSYEGIDFEYDLAEIEDLRDAVKGVDAGIIVTASIASDVSAADAGQMSEDANLDVASWHEERVNNYWDATASEIASLKSTEDEAPIYLQEPERMRPNQAWPTADDLAENVFNARIGGAAAWGFHTVASHHMDGSRLESLMQPEESDFLNCLVEAVAYGTCSSEEEAPAQAAAFGGTPLAWLIQRRRRHA